ncbi:hypothetical protein BCL80_12415 [Streptomyces avidinii]|nr:hypothetical protein BCL80_12415 [Streptomyces avidinii]SNX81226.1 hypothetical protein SAMN05421860_12215 [Streptomyces microflavus]
MFNLNLIPVDHLLELRHTGDPCVEKRELCLLSLRTQPLPMLYAGLMCDLPTPHIDAGQHANQPDAASYELSPLFCHD